MKTNIKNIVKQSYSSPQIDRIKMDNEISLVLESLAPDEEPDWTNVLGNDKNDPFKTLAG